MFTLLQCSTTCTTMQKMSSQQFLQQVSIFFYSVCFLIVHSRCNSGVSVNGNTTSDVTCKSNSDSTTAPTSNKITSSIKHLQSQRPHEGAKTQEINQGSTTSTTASTTATTTATPRPAAPSTNKVNPGHPSDTGNHIGKTFPASI